MQTPITNLKDAQRLRYTGALTWEDLWDNPEIQETFHSSFESLIQYIYLARNTESPKQFHLWSLLSLTAALASNHTYLGHGILGKQMLNLGVILSGRAAVRKSSAINFMQRFATGLPLNYGPTDTGGARHGIMASMLSRWQDDIKDESDVQLSLETLAKANFDSIIAVTVRRRTRPSSVYFTAKELGRLLTAQTRELLDFFNDGLDGEPIYYQTKAGSVRIPSPIINLLGATTPGSLPHILPRDSHDHGFLSRLIFVYAGRPEEPVPHVPLFTSQEANIQAILYEKLKRIGDEADGEITFDPQANELYESLYLYAVPTIEHRLAPYSGRRASHLAKLAACICLLRGESPYVITVNDVGLAHIILILTEQDMDGAYAGLDRTTDGRAYAYLRDIIESSEKESIREDEALKHLARSGLMKTHDESAGTLIRIKTADKLQRVDGSSDYRVHRSIGADKARLFLDSFRKKYMGV